MPRKSGAAVACGAACGAYVKEPRKYCNNLCQQSAQRMARTEQWLATGDSGSEWDPTHAGHFIRTHIWDEQDGQCAICTLSEWLSKPIVFTLDHLDGDAKNNSRGNLRLICPNCDSQLPTYKGRNRGKGTRPPRKNRYN